MNLRSMLAATTAGLLLGALPAAAAQDQALIDKGKAVYEAQRCALCHAIGGRGNAKGPLDGVGTRLSEADIRKWIVSPKEMKSPTNRKPDMRAYPNLPAGDLDALVAYMLSLKGA
ncbi:MAG: cytochrome c [Vicinamibacterales bacterium]